MKHWFSYIVVLLTIVSCSTPQQVYFSDAVHDSSEKILNTYIETIHPGDQLYIYVYSTMPEVVIPFNQETLTQSIPEVQEYENFAKNVHKVNGYKVSSNGYIQFPILGSIHVGGLTQDSVERIIQKQLVDNGYVSDAVVTVNSMNFRVSVIGEVASPKELHVEGDRLTILEALAMCGDITLSGQRNNVIVMREKGNNIVPIEIDLTQKTMFDSEAYYMQSNDIVYVEPNKKLKKTSHRGNNWPAYVSLGASIARLVMLLGVGYKGLTNN